MVKGISSKQSIVIIILCVICMSTLQGISMFTHEPLPNQIYNFFLYIIIGLGGMEVGRRLPTHGGGE